MKAKTQDSIPNIQPSVETASTPPFPPIIYQDDDILVINKPAGLIVEESHTHDKVTLEQMLPESDQLERRGIVHRLDRDTSGLIIIAKTAQAQQNLKDQFQQRTIRKQYQALVWGKVKDAHAHIDAPIARHPKAGHKFVVIEEGRAAQTEFWTEKIYRFGEEAMTLLKVAPHTGRTHQIRVHLHALGHPIVGDPVYGRRKDKTGIRMFLHASHLEFTHPTTNKPLSFDVSLPEGLSDFLKKLTNEERE